MARTCSSCGTGIGPRGKTGRCRPCHTAWLLTDPEMVAKRAEARLAFNTARRMDRPHCAECGIEVGLKSKWCRPCARSKFGRDPEVRSRAAATLAEKHRTDPAFHEQHRARVQAAMDRCKQDPAFSAQRREHGRRYGKHNIELTRSPESRAKAGKTNSARRLAHIPPGYRAYYRELIKKKLPATERARLAIERYHLDRAHALAAQAAVFLQRTSSVYRCDEGGQPCKTGKFWRRGTATMTDADLVQRAIGLGWDPDAWRRVPGTSSPHASPSSTNRRASAPEIRA
ncbi:hypothetical protein HNP52_000324 [Sphingomonas kyeonggiensis]|uniref:Uncharacterized protein n=1 Tax=Sphingomonas kyeonggiensis TaxID=1268553 RepID=A0A7W7NPW9_9SPHN|nr:hypothetical protein [Sphingomonas kyeonggiensis]MBB4837273.1 hypothetical protein [Sphingomonas kyeonggiensis]